MSLRPSIGFKNVFVENPV